MDTDSRMRTCRIAAVQMASEDGRVAVNLARALPLVEQAAARGAELVCLPEFMPTGYVFSTAIPARGLGEPTQPPSLPDPDPVLVVHVS